MIRLLLAIGMFAAWLVPPVAGADLICQQRKSKRIILAAECPKKFHPIFDLGPITALAGQVETLQGDIDEVRGLANAVKPIAASSITATEIKADAIDGTKVKANSLALDDLAPSLVLPFPSNQAGSHGRIVSADLDMSTADGDDVGVDSPDGEGWLSLVTFDEDSATAYFLINPGVFEEMPRCVAGVTDSGAPDVVRSLGLQVGEDDAGQWIRVRVTGQNRQLDVTGTVICTGAAKL